MITLDHLSFASDDTKNQLILIDFLSTLKRTSSMLAQATKRNERSIANARSTDVERQLSSARSIAQVRNKLETSAGMFMLSARTICDKFTYVLNFDLSTKDRIYCPELCAINLEKIRRNSLFPYIPVLLFLYIFSVCCIVFCFIIF